LPRPKKDNLPKSQSLLEKVQSELKIEQSYSSLILGLLIVLVVGVLTFNYFKQNQPEVGPSQQAASENEEVKDVEPDNLPGKYIVKEGDTLFTIAQTYYSNGYLFNKIAEANKLANVDIIEVGQSLEIPKAEDTEVAQTAEDNNDEGTGGAVNQTIWGEKIEGDTYTVAEGDWLSTIAGRAYGDVMAYEKIAQANNIVNPDLIEPGTILTLPR